jgi:TatD DNase family protein
VAIGEVGLDFYRDLSPRDVQLRALEAQLDLAVASGKPVSVHSRGAEDAIYEPLSRYAARGEPSAPGVMHCFGGTLEQARRYVELGFLVSLSCAVTYPKNQEARRIAAQLPLISLAVETDAPYLPPQHRRGKRNEPAFVEAAATEIARARGIPAGEAAEATALNACRVFRIGVPAEVR